MQSWYQELFGCSEGSYSSVQQKIRVTELPTGHALLEGPNGVSYRAGAFQTPSLQQLETAAANLGGMAELRGKLQVRNVTADVMDLLIAEENRHATFQVASQFNCLEFVGPSVRPEDGVTRYDCDRTQGPACSVACGPATVYRNYFAEVSGSRGQTSQRQIENLRDLLLQLGGPREFLDVVGGYTLASNDELKALNGKLAALDAAAHEALKKKLRVGVHEDVQVTCAQWGQLQLRDKEQLVTQVFAAACSVSYSGNGQRLWAPLARLILAASYEATLYAALANALRKKGKHASQRLFLTCLGGGVFGNDITWIADAMREAFAKFQDVALEVVIVTFRGRTEPELQALER